MYAELNKYNCITDVFTEENCDGNVTMHKKYSNMPHFLNAKYYLLL